MFELLPNLKYLDGYDRDDQEAEDDEDEGELPWLHCCYGFFCCNYLKKDVRLSFGQNLINLWKKMNL